VLSDDLARARRLAQSLAADDLRFVCNYPQAHERMVGAWATFDLVLLHLGRERLGRGMPKEILHQHPSYVVALERPTTGSERARWIENGADDCVSLPCDPQELLARLRASLRRRRAGDAWSGCLSVGPLTLWPRERNASLDGRPLALTTCEFSLLVALTEHAGEVLGREKLLEFAKGSPDQAFDRAIDVQISRLRAKLGDDPRHPRLLKTVRGLGYVLVGDRSSNGDGTCPPADASR
jgi:DNA-binding response OmpR family regulator